MGSVTGHLGCFCVNPDHVKEEFWHGGCEHCAYGNGACAYSTLKGWYCLCEEGNDGPDCIHKSWENRKSNALMEGEKEADKFVQGTKLGEKCSNCAQKFARNGGCEAMAT